MSYDFETIVIGAGAMGTAAAVYLAKAGSQVALIDQFHFGHDRGSSHGESRIIRYSYADRRYVRLARAAYQLWHEMEAAVSARLITTAGGLDLGFAGSADFEGCIASLTAERVAFELIESCEIEARFAQLNVDSDKEGLSRLRQAYSTRNAVLRRCGLWLVAWVFTLSVANLLRALQLWLAR